MNVWIGVALLALLAMLFVLAPALLHRKRVQPDRRAANVAIAKARLAELHGDFAAGVIGADDYALLKLEQERRVLAEADAAARPAGLKDGRWLLVVVAVAVPLLAAGAYYHLGAWTDWRIQALLKRSENEMQVDKDNRPALDALRKALQQRLEQRDDDDGRRRFMLAQIDTEFARYGEAVEQYTLLQKKFPEDASIAAHYAQAQYLAADRHLSAEALSMAQRALQLDPNQSTALGLLGLTALENKDYAQALVYWRHLLRQLPPGSTNAAMIEAGVKQAEQGLGSAGFPGPKLVVSVSLAPQLVAALPAGGTLFVFAKAVNGPPMPLAAARLDPAQLPLEITLDDSMAMVAGMNLSSAKQVQVFARITASGQVRGEPGDLEGSSGPLQLTPAAQKLSVSIDRKL